MTNRTYTPEAIAALVKAANEAKELLKPEVRKEPDRSIFWHLFDALRPFTTEPSSWASYALEIWGEGWETDFEDGDWDTGVVGRQVSEADYAAARDAYRARYGVEP